MMDRRLPEYSQSHFKVLIPTDGVSCAGKYDIQYQIEETVPDDDMSLFDKAIQFVVNIFTGQEYVWESFTYYEGIEPSIDEPCSTSFDAFASRKTIFARMVVPSGIGGNIFCGQFSDCTSSLYKDTFKGGCCMYGRLDDGDLSG